MIDLKRKEIFAVSMTSKIYWKEQEYELFLEERKAEKYHKKVLFKIES